VLSYARDRTVRLWSVEDSSQTIGSFQFDEAFESNDDASLSLTGDRLVVQHGGVVRLWPYLASTQSVIDAGCAALTQPLSRAQRREFFLDEDPKDPPCGWHPDAKDKPRR
jgi:hypothetical protein